MVPASEFFMFYPVRAQKPLVSCPDGCFLTDAGTEMGVFVSGGENSRGGVSV